jgi:hypothetical protein
MSIMLLLAAAGAAPQMINQPVKDKPVAEIASGESYLLVRSAGGLATSIAFFREADPAERTDYQSRRAEALTKAHAKWVKKHASWKKELASWKQSPPGNRGAEPEEPIEPTEDSFDFPAIEEEQMIVVGPFNRFAKDKVNDLSVYVSKVRPGRYHLYGPLMLNPQGGALGTCTCMGSVSFEVAPGQITDAGTMLLNVNAAWQAARDGKGPKVKDDFDLPEGVTQVGWDPATDRTPVDPRLGSFKIVKADLRPTGPFPNWYKAQVDRLTAVPGILQYDRDRIIDPRKGNSGSGQ